MRWRACPHGAFLRVLFSTERRRLLLELSKIDKHQLAYLAKVAPEASRLQGGFARMLFSAEDAMRLHLCNTLSCSDSTRTVEALQTENPSQEIAWPNCSESSSSIPAAGAS